MPVHEYRCDCGFHFDNHMPFGSSVGTRVCPDCGDLARKVWNVPEIRPDYQTHYNEQLDAVVKSRRHEKEVVKHIIDRTEGKMAPDWH